MLTAAQCGGLVELYASADLFRSRVIMSRHGYGRGEYHRPVQGTRGIYRVKMFERRA